MPWGDRSVMDLRQEFVVLAQHKSLPFAELCDRFKISRKTGYKWIARYQALGHCALADRSRQPLHSPARTPQPMIDTILAIRDKHPVWGAKKIHAILQRKGIVDAPAVSTINKILKRENRIQNTNERLKQLIRFEHEEPNLLWQMDYKGHFAYNAGRCHPLTILDDHSRYSIGLIACHNERGETVKKCMIDCFHQYGLPQRINVDNGQPWGSLFYHARYTTLSLWLIQLGIQVSYSRPGHPQTNGKDERFHRTLKAEVIRPRYFRDMEEIQTVFDAWRQTYNFERPHEGIGMSVPAERYRPSYRRYTGLIETYEYSPDYRVLKVDTRGRLRVNQRAIYVGTVFSGEGVGIRELVSGEIAIYYRHQALGEIDLNDIPRGGMMNLFSHELKCV